MLRSAFVGLRASAAALLVLAPLSGTAITLSVPNDHPTIQAAVDAAVAGDVVKVGSGTYPESVSVVTAGVTLTGSKGAVIDGQGVGVPLTVTASDVIVSGFTMNNGSTANLLPM